MKITSIVSSGLLALFVFVSLTGVAAAHGGAGDVGVSYHCSEEGDSSGGGKAIWVSSSGNFSPVGFFTVLRIGQDAYFYAQQKAAHPQRSDTCDGGDGSTDYAEAHAGPVQACHTDNANDTTDVRTDDGDACHPSQNG